MENAVETKTISRKDLGDEQYIMELESILEGMSEQTEVMYEAIELAITALVRVKECYEGKLPFEDNESVAETMYRMTDLALSMLKGEPEADENTH